MHTLLRLLLTGLFVTFAALAGRAGETAPRERANFDAGWRAPGTLCLTARADGIVPAEAASLSPRPDRGARHAQAVSRDAPPFPL